MLRPSAYAFKKIVESKPVNILECGTWRGDNAIELYKAFNINEMVMIDLYYESYEHYNFKEIKTFPAQVFEKFYGKHNAIIMKCDTLRAASFFPDEYFDYIYLDDNHSYDHVIKELELYFPKLKKGGIYSGDNYEMTGVEKAVNIFTQSMDYKLNTEYWEKCKGGTSATDWWITKK